MKNYSTAHWLAVLALISSCTTARAQGQAASAQPTASFRQEHVKVQEHLRHVHEWVGALGSQDPATQQATARKVVTFFEQHIKPHAEWEERFLYPIVDRLAAGPNAFTSTMRHEHRIVGRWIAELRAESEKPKLDVAKFSRRADNLLGLIWAHFEEEEEVLLPFIDKGMSKAQFEKQLHEAGKRH
jgi:hemerythrin-like domain-containing protein